MEFKTLSYKNLRNTGLVMVFKCVMMIVLLSVVSLSAHGQKNEKLEVNGVTFEMVYVPGGTFTMGATAEQGDDAWDDEKPTHSVTLSGYYIGKYEVTQAQWKAIMGNNSSWFKGDNLPVENVSWDDCQTFIRKLNHLTGKNFSLPTEAQWEYAARGGKSGGSKYSGSDNIENVAWYWNNAGEKTHPVGTKSPNDLGIYDMSGNVSEWCQDWYGGNYYNNSPTTNPTGPNSGSYRVGRGGSWDFSARGCRVSNRNYGAPGYGNGYLGFRLSLSEQQDEESVAEVSNEINFSSNIKKIEVKGVTFEMVKVPGGTFTMGATAEQGDDVWNGEKPAHSVTLSGYYIGKYEVTQAQWKAIMGTNPSYLKGDDNLPVENVSWDDCQEFIRKLNELTGKKFSLPTEAQWEYAARGGKSGGTKYSGSDNIEEVAWYIDNSGHDILHPVGMKLPNSLGIYDMSGNVREWCQDWRGDYSSYSQTNPTGPDSGSYRVDRGGCWSYYARYCRVSMRSYNAPGIRFHNLGFRLCL